MKNAAHLTAGDFEAIEEIVTRVLKWVPDLNRTTVFLDLAMCHLNVCQLKLDAMRNVDDEHRSDVLHDVFGIAKHMNRRTMKMGDCFLPRYAR